jgi:hypothetical protein
VPPTHRTRNTSRQRVVIQPGPLIRNHTRSFATPFMHSAVSTPLTDGRKGPDMMITCTSVKRLELHQNLPVRAVTTHEAPSGLQNIDRATPRSIAYCRSPFSKCLNFHSIFKALSNLIFSSAITSFLAGGPNLLGSSEKLNRERPATTAF